MLILSIKSPPSRFFACQIKGDTSLPTVSIGTIVYFRFSEFIRLSLWLRFRFAAACLPFFVIKSENNGSTMDFERCAKALTKRTVLSHDCFLPSRTQVCAQINLIYLTLYVHNFIQSRKFPCITKLYILIPLYQRNPCNWQVEEIRCIVGCIYVVQHMEVSAQLNYLSSFNITDSCRLAICQARLKLLSRLSPR